MGPVDALLEKALVYVTGKGGAGKTTVAAALGLAAAACGRRALVCDLAGSNQLARAFGRPRDARGELRLTERLFSLSVDPQEALEEWLRRQPGGAAAAAVLKRSHAFGHFVAAAPGAKELVMIGKVVDRARPDPGSGTRPASDLVVVDGPSTGHALGMPAAPRTVGEVASVGSVGRQARELRDFLRDPVAAGYVGVSLPEEMSVREILELERELPDAVGRGLDLIVVNGVYPDRFTDEEAEQLLSFARQHPSWRSWRRSPTTGMRASTWARCASSASTRRRPSSRCRSSSWRGSGARSTRRWPRRSSTRPEPRGPSPRRAAPKSLGRAGSSACPPPRDHVQRSPNGRRGARRGALPARPARRP